MSSGSDGYKPGGGMLEKVTEKVVAINTGGTKHDTGKNRLELIPVEAIEQIGLAFTFGAKKYDDNNWRKGFDWERLRGALMRHTLAWAKGEDLDPESGLSHLAHAGACLAMLITHEQLNYGRDNRVKTKN